MRFTIFFLSILWIFISIRSIVYSIAHAIPHTQKHEQQSEHSAAPAAIITTNGMVFMYEKGEIIFPNPLKIDYPSEKCVIHTNGCKIININILNKTSKRNLKSIADISNKSSERANISNQSKKKQNELDKKISNQEDEASYHALNTNNHTNMVSDHRLSNRNSDYNTSAFSAGISNMLSNACIVCTNGAKISCNDFFVSGKRLEYMNKGRVVRISGDALMKDKNGEIAAESLDYSLTAKKLVALGNVVVRTTLAPIYKANAIQKQEKAQ